MANRYWVTAGAVWDATNTAPWSETSGGTGGASAPTINDDVFFTQSYGSGGPAIYDGAICKSVTFNINQNINFFGFLTVGTQKINALTTGTTFTTPADWNNASNNIYLIGGGGGGAGSNFNGTNRAAGGGGGGGGFRILTNQTLSGNVSYTIGAGGTAGAAGTGTIRVAGTGGTTTWGVSNTATGGTGGSSVSNPTPISTGGAGGTGTFTGGNGGLGATNSGSTGCGGGGGGGGAGPNGNGGNGGTGIVDNGGVSGGGGGNGGGTSGGDANGDEGFSGAGGNNSLGTGGGLSVDKVSTGNAGLLGGGGSGGLGANRSGGRGGNGIDVLGVRGSGGGMGGCGAFANNAAVGLYGGGGGGAGHSGSASSFAGGAGAQGAIIIVYTPLPPYSVGNSEVANYVNTTSGQVIDVTANNGLGGPGVVTRASLTGRIDLSFVVATNIQFLTIDVTSLSGYIAGKTDVTITVNAGVYVYGTVPTTYIGSPNAALIASMQIIGGAAGDTIKLVNNGNIVGTGGDGAGATTFVSDCCGCGWSLSQNRASPGNAALSLITPGISVTIENNGYIAGGGGGGGAAGGNQLNGNVPGGGGGAGGGISGIVGTVPNATSSGITNRAVPPNAGATGVSAYRSFGCCSTLTALNGGGGGFVLPGTGGVYNEDNQGLGSGGGAGGGGASSSTNVHTYNNDGGSANNAATTYTTFGDAYQGGGGGGWGASGAAGYLGTSLNQAGAAGGNSIVTNGNAYTLTGSGQLYGSVNTALTSVVYTFPTSVYTGMQFDLETIPGYTSGTNVVLMVPASVRLASNNNISPGLEIFKSGAAGTRPTSIRLMVNGAILGAGGRGGSEANIPGAGGVAILVSITAFVLIVENPNGYVAGGGAGGGRSLTTGTARYPYGGGGAGYGGSSGSLGSAAYNAGVVSGVSAGNNGTVNGAATHASGGSGGTILPGERTPNTGTFTTGLYAGLGGQAGGSGAFYVITSITDPNNYGGEYGVGGGSTANTAVNVGGGGGGWGGNGGPGRRGATVVQSGGSGGKAIYIPAGGVSVYVTNPNNIAGLIGV